MELTDEQYNRILKFVDQEMDEAEYAAFKVVLSRDEELNDEVEFYKEIKSLGASIGEKLDMPGLALTLTKKDETGDAELMIKKARENWENHHENDVQQKYDISAIEEENTSIPEQGKVRKMSLWIKLTVAATILGVISLSAIWYVQNSKEEVKTAAGNKQKGLSSKDQMHADSSENIGNRLPSPTQKEDSISVVKTTPGNTTKQIKNRTGTFELKPFNKVKNDALFADNFEPDSVPQDKTGPLQTALIHYENKEYAEAINTFENIDLAPVTRGEANDSLERTIFYAHYYKGLSYLAADNPAKAITELKNSISADPYLVCKAQWYLALAYLKTGQSKKAKVILKQVIDNDGTKVYRLKAKTLLSGITE